MAKILGIDAGTNSVGFSYIDDKSKKIIKSGTRIFPESVNKGGSSDKPKNQERREKRGIRKLNFRFKLRRNRLRRVLSKLGMFPDNTYFTSKKGDTKNLTIELYKLRKRALEERLSLQELGRIFYHLNTHRGFKSNKKEEAKLEFENNSEALQKEKNKIDKSAKELQDKINLAKSNGFIKYGTIGEYFYWLIEQNKNSNNPNEPIEKIRNNDKGEGHYTLRKMYEDEFDLIWEKQIKLNSEIGNTSIVEVLSIENKKEIGENTIFFQRDLRKQKHLINNCPYEYTEYYGNERIKDENGIYVDKRILKKSFIKCTAKSSLEFQEFRIWETLNNLRYSSSSKDLNDVPLKLYQKLIFAKLLDEQEIIKLKTSNKKESKQKFQEFLNKVELPFDAKFNDIEEIKGNITKIRIINAIGKDIWNEFDLYKNSKLRDELINKIKLYFWQFKNTQNNELNNDFIVIGNKLDDIWVKLTKKEKEVSKIQQKIFDEKFILEFNNDNINVTSIQTGEIFKVRINVLPTLYSDKQLMLWHNLVFADEFTKNKEWLTGQFNGKINSWKNNIFELKLDKQIIDYSNVKLEPDYCKYSSKALKKLIPLVKLGFDIRKCEKILGYVDNSSIRNNDDRLLYEIPKLKNNELRNPVVQQGMGEIINVINSIIRDEELGKPDIIRIEMPREMKKSQKGREDIRLEQLKKSNKRKEYAKFLSSHLKRFIDISDSRIFKFELFLELSENTTNFDEIKSQISINEFIDFCKNVLGNNSFSLSNEDFDDAKRNLNKKENSESKNDKKEINSKLLKYRLWLECGRVLPYENKVISLTELFSPSIEIEHIIPYSRCFDNSFLNKTLSTSSFNQLKTNKTPYEYFEEIGELEHFKKKIKNFSDAKKMRFLMKTDEIDDFKNSQINNTAYIAKGISEHLRTTFKADKIELTNGTVTSLLRGWLGFNTILNPSYEVDFSYPDGKYWAVIDENSKELIELIIQKDNIEPIPDRGEIVIEGYISDRFFKPKKSRNDHRHHAVDAIVIALTSRRIIQIIETATQGRTINGNWVDAFDENGNWTKEAIKEVREKVKNELDFPRLRVKAKDSIEDILVSYRSDLKLTSTGKKKIYDKYGKPIIIKGKPMYSGGDVARGKLHAESVYGKIDNPHTHEENYVIKKPLTFDTKGGIFSTIWHIDSIVDLNIKQIIYKNIEDEANLENEIFPIKLKIEENEQIFKNINEIICLQKELTKAEKKEIDKILNKSIKTVLKNGIYLPNYSKENDDENTIRKPVQVKSVRMSKSGELLLLKKHKMGNKSAYVENDDNYAIAIYGSQEDLSNRESKTLSRLESSRIIAENNKLKKEGKPKVSVIPEKQNGKPLLYSLSKKDMVLVYKEHEDEFIFNTETNFCLNDSSFLFNRLFFVVKLEMSGKINLMRHNISGVNADEATSIDIKNIDNGLGAVIRCRYSTIKAIKVDVLINGQIKKIK